MPKAIYTRVAIILSTYLPCFQIHQLCVDQSHCAVEVCHHRITATFFYQYNATCASSSTQRAWNLEYACNIAFLKNNKFFAIIVHVTEVLYCDSISNHKDYALNARRQHFNLSLSQKHNFRQKDWNTIWWCVISLITCPRSSSSILNQRGVLLVQISDQDISRRAHCSHHIISNLMDKAALDDPALYTYHPANQPNDYSTDCEDNIEWVDIKNTK